MNKFRKELLRGGSKILDDTRAEDNIIGCQKFLRLRDVFTELKEREHNGDEQGHVEAGGYDESFMPT